MLILLDGPKGAGKSSVSQILADKLDNVICLSLDAERRALPDQGRGRTELNKEAFENIIHKTERFLKENRNLIIDCGLTEERVQRLERVASDGNAQIYKFLLQASRGTLLGRVRMRDSAKNQKTNVERFDEVLKIVHAKEFSNFNIIETDGLSVKEVADRILKIV